MGSRTRILFQLWNGSSRQDMRNFDQSGQGKFLPSQFEGVVPRPNGRWEAQVYQSHRPRVGLCTFNQEEELGCSNVQRQATISNFKRAEESHPETLTFLSEHSTGELVKNAHAVSVIDGVRRDGNEEKGGGEASEKSERPSGKEKSSREHMFDKVVTPSDVGKLNRLVIPKQHAEKYFPLDTNANEKGLLLNFEDNTGKTWRFPYSYWNSSQSYVLTKGWSRFVKEKKLDAGDIGSFERGTDAQDVERPFISWKRQPCALQPTKAALLRGLSTSPAFQYAPFQYHGLSIRAGGGKLGQPQHLNAFSEWMSVVWSANSGEASSRPSPMWAEQMDARQPQPQPQPLRMDMRFHAEEVQNSAREPLDFMQLKAPPPEQSWPVQNASVKSSNKGVRLFGVNL